MLKCPQDKQFFVLVRTEQMETVSVFFAKLKKKFVFVLVFRNCLETNQNKKSVLQNKPKLKINTLLFNGHRCGNGRGKGHRNIYDLFVLVFFAKLNKKNLVVSVFQNHFETNRNL
jgi:hypothetical protein